ncbi:hypothetical protein IT568_04660 [bacterium]|nr:hypothetical protein [bacterium]
MVKIRQTFVFLIVSVFAVACANLSTQKKHFGQIDKNVDERNFVGAIQNLEKAKEKYYDKKDKVVFCLDLGMLYHLNGDYEKSNEVLTKADYSIEELYTKSISRIGSSFLLNDNVLDYEGEDYENIYLTVFKSLNYLNQKKTEEAFVEIRRINEKLALLEDKYKKIADEFNKQKDVKKEFQASENKFHNSCLARFVSLLLNRNAKKTDDARIDLEKIDEAWISQSQLYDFAKPDFSNYLKNNGKAKVNFLGFIGKTPEKFAKNLTIHTEKDVVIIYQSDGQDSRELEAIPWYGVMKGLHFKFSLPYLERKGTQVGKVEVEMDNKKILELDLLENLENVATETFSLREPLIYTKTLTRTIIKGIAAELANRQLDKKFKDGDFGFLTRLATSAIVDASENADLRVSRYFPAKALVGELEVEEGKHYFRINYYSKTGTLIFTDEIGEKEIKANQLNLFQSNYFN